MIKKVILVFIFSTIAFSSVTAQAVLYKIPLEEQVKESSLILEGQIIDKKSYLSILDHHIYTINRVKVHRVFKGKYKEYINVVTKGGDVNFKRETVTPSLQLRLNEIGVFTLQENSNEFEDFESEYSNYHAFSGLQGFYKYDESQNTVFNPYYNFSGIQTSFYEAIESLTGSNVEFVNYTFSYEKAAKGLSTTEIIGFSPEEVRSGIGETVTIMGSDFGTEQGFVSFRDSDNGGFSFLEVYDSDIISWTNTSITVNVPSYAGTGDVRIDTANGNEIISTQTLTVLSSELNTAFTALPEQEFRPKLIESNNNGGYTWTYNSEFAENTDAVASFERAIDTWVCETGISWIIDDEYTDISTTSEDGINVISFGNPNNGDISFGVLAVTTTLYVGCQDGDNVNSYVSEIDMIFNDTFTWHYGEEEPSNSENDFQGTATHELGHAHNLGHVIAPTNLMHFETNSGVESATRDIDDDSRIGAELSYAFAKEDEDALCNQKVAEDRDCMDDSILTLESFVFVESPVKGRLFVSIKEKDTQEYNFFLYSLNGRLLSQEIFSSQDPSVEINNWTTGIYIVKITVDSSIYVQKIVILN